MASGKFCYAEVILKDSLADRSPYRYPSATISALAVVSKVLRLIQMIFFQCEKEL